MKMERTLPQPRDTRLDQDDLDAAHLRPTSLLQPDEGVVCVLHETVCGMAIWRYDVIE